MIFYPDLSLITCVNNCSKSEMFLPKFLSLVHAVQKQHNLTRIQLGFRFFSNQMNYEELILKNTVVTEKHLTPEIKLRLITSECPLWYSEATESVFPNDPFWGIYWPGGQALGRFILDNSELFHQKTVLDIGCGSGACALAAAKSGAKLVLANDVDPISLSAVQINSRLNNLKVHTCAQDLIGKDLDSLVVTSENKKLQLEWDVILLGDMFYDTDFSFKLFPWLSNLVRKNKLVLIGDPGRHTLKELESMKNFGFVEKISEYSLLNVEHNGFSTSSVFKIVLSNSSSNTASSKTSLPKTSSWKSSNRTSRDSLEAGLKAK